MTDRLTTPWWALRAALGVAAFLAGLDKFFNLLANWPIAAFTLAHLTEASVGVATTEPAGTPSLLSARREMTM